MSAVTVSSDLYVYYQVDASDAPALAQRVRAMQAELGTGQLKRRPLVQDGRQTWMEIYPACTEDGRVAIEAAVRRAALLELTSGERHVEVFVELDDGAAPCA